MKVTPCKDCKNRTLGCHSFCDEYGEWKKEYYRIKDIRGKYIYLETAIKGQHRKRKHNYQ